uniref:Uncharacterized protein n=1 Tax=Nelumbo nucifera TaxID=4432 RepID=A0A822YS51_NELNU|nr:TPA_asm: hypothetical protein HUJ06_012457 [Nelumbo nucifera]
MVLKLGLMFSSSDPASRLTMRQVVRYLEGEARLPEAVSAPEAGEYKSGKNEEGFNDLYIPTSSSEKVSSHSFMGTGDIEADLSSF